MTRRKVRGEPGAVDKDRDEEKHNASDSHTITIAEHLLPLAQQVRLEVLDQIPHVDGFSGL
jgi:hypothetical protein